MFRRSPGCALFCVLLALAANGASARAADATVYDIDGGNRAGTVTALSDASLSLDRRALRTADLFKVEWTGRQPVPMAESPMILLANGDVLAAIPQVLDDEKLIVAWTHFPAWKPVRVPLETVRGVVLAVSRDPVAQAKLIQTIENHREKGDLLQLRNGDRLSGELVELTGVSLSLAGAAGKTHVDRESVLSVAFSGELTSFPKIDGQQMLFSLIDGSRITAHQVALEANGTLRLKAAFGADLELPLTAVSAIRFLGGRTVYLSDLKPVEYRFTPYLSDNWDLRNDRNAAGGVLRLRGATFAKGLGTHSRCEITYDLNGAYRQFRASAGIDDMAGGRGSAIFAVQVDGKPVFTSEPIGGEDSAQSIGPIDVRGKNRLTLVVDFGPFGDIQDHADWCDAVLVKSKD